MNSKQPFNFLTRIISSAVLCCLALLGGAGLTVASEYELSSEAPSSASRNLQPIDHHSHPDPLAVISRRLDKRSSKH